MELAVAGMLIVLGAVNLFGRPRASDAAFAPVRPVMIGFVHGLAGSAAVALLVLTTIGDPRWSAAYLLVYGLGTVSGHSTVMTGQTVRASAAAPGGVEGASAARRQAAMVKGSAALVIRQSFSSSRAMMSFWISVVPS
jgi:high-affinity nickel-transport protein